MNAGHQPAILRNGQGKYDQFESSAPPLGVIKQKIKVFIIFIKQN